MMPDEKAPTNASPSPMPESELLHPEAEVFHEQVKRLHRVTVYGRWLVASCLWLTIGAWSLWSFRDDIALVQEYFTWAAVRAGLSCSQTRVGGWLPCIIPLRTLGLTLCIGVTTSVLVWQSRNILFGLPRPEKRRLEQQVQRIRQQGRSHPLWKWVMKMGL